MASLVEQLIQTNGSQIAEQISTRLGIPAEKAAGVLPAVAPLIFGAIQKQAQEPGGEESANDMVDQAGDASVPDDIGGFLFNAQSQAQGLTGGLGGLLGGGGGQIAEAIAEKIGVPKEKANDILTMLGPIILGFLTKQKSRAGGGASLVTSMLDRDGDGQILDDVAGMLGVGGTLGTLLGAGEKEKGAGNAPSGAGDLLGKALGGLLGGKS